LLFAATLLASLATPMLPGALRTAWHYQAHDVMVNSGIISEMHPIYHGWGGAITVAFLAGVVAVAMAHRRQVRVGEWLWLAVGIVMSLRLGRFTPMLALIAAPLLAATLPAMNDRVLRRPIVAVALAIVLAFSLVRIVMSFPGRDMPMDRWINRLYGPKVVAFPTGAAEYVAANITPRSHRLINEFNWGGYLAWRLGDRFQVFLDGRTQLYSAEFWRATYLGSDDDAARIIAGADADVAIIPIEKPRFGLALQKLGWRTVYRDEIAQVLLPPAH
jgi:hypothetical protein